jgi:hypothetical protein
MGDISYSRRSTGHYRRGATSGIEQKGHKAQQQERVSNYHHHNKESEKGSESYLVYSLYIQKQPEDAPT